ncbi:MAG: ABC transporter permease [Sulfolobaceae archaeon]
MIREFFDLVIMQFKMIKIYLPAIIFYSVFIPIGLLLIFGVNSLPTTRGYAIAGTITTLIAMSGITGVSQTIAYERNIGRFSLLLSAGIRPWLYAISIIISYGISSIITIPVVIITGEYVFGIKVQSPYMLLYAILSCLFTSSMIGLGLGYFIKNIQAINQLSPIIAFTLIFFAPVYYSIDAIPSFLVPLTFLEPTTYMSQGIFYAIQGSTISILWSTGCLIYGIIVISIMKLLD